MIKPSVVLLTLSYVLTLTFLSSFVVSSSSSIRSSSISINIADTTTTGLISNSSYQCSYVDQGDFYADGNGEIPNWWGFRDYNIVKRQYNMSNLDWQYLMEESNPIGAMCSESWNKLFGASRCGYLHSHHEDSDRFVWRRHPACVITNGSHVIGQVPNCPEAGQIQLAAYAYDRGNKPYQNSSLLTQFETSIYVDQLYTMEIVFQPTSAVYTLYTSIESGMKEIESHTIQHTDCDEWDHGYMLGFYFGGECAAPSYVSTCFWEIEQ